eukprot:3761645-Pyramimonas_sp.AAC.1
MRIYHWHPAAFFPTGGSTWTLVRNLLEGGEAVDKLVNVDRTKDQQRADMMNNVRGQQCQCLARRCFAALRVQSFDGTFLGIFEK